MAWFDYAAALGQGLEQGVDQLRAVRAERRLVEDRDRQRKQEERKLALEALALEDPENISPEWLAQHGKFAKDFLHKGPTGFRIKESPAAATTRRLQGMQQEELDATLKDKSSARALMRDRTAFKALPYEQKMMAMETLGLGSTTMDAYLTPAEKRQRIQQSAEYLLQSARLAASRAENAASIQGRLAEAFISARNPGQITDSKLLEEAVGKVSRSPQSLSMSDEEYADAVRNAYDLLQQKFPARSAAGSSASSPPHAEGPWKQSGAFQRRSIY